MIRRWCGPVAGGSLLQVHVLTRPTDMLSASGFSGQVLDESNPNYDSYQRLNDPRFDARPAAIARCTSVRDVQTALAFASEHGLDVAVRAGGHGFHGHATIADGLVIDLRPHDELAIDLERGVAHISAGASSDAIVAQTCPHGLAPVGASSDGVGYGGVVIFGGQNYLSPRHGWGCDNLVGCEVVLAGGDVVYASATSEPELFWAMRGAGDNFGVITRFDAQLHSVRPVIRMGLITWDARAGRAALLALAELDDDLSEDLWWGARFHDLNGDVGVSVWYYHLGSRAVAEKEIRLLERLARPRQSLSRKIGYLEAYADADVALRGRRGYVAGCELPTLDGAAIDILVEATRRQLAEPPEIRACRILGGKPYRKAMSGPPDQGSCFNRYEGFVVMANGWYDDPTHAAAHETSADAVVEKLVDAGLTLDGANVCPPNWVTPVDYATVRAAFGAEHHDRLIEIKRRYDPTNVFDRSLPLLPPSG